MTLLVFGFYGNHTEAIAEGLAAKDNVVILDSTLESIDNFISTISTINPTHILGLGSYSGMGAAELRIETMCTSQFRNNTQNLERRRIPFFLHSAPQFKLTNGIGNSWCNLVSYKIVTQYPSVPFTFLHIPKNFPVDEAIRAINEQLNLEKTEAE